MVDCDSARRMSLPPYSPRPFDHPSNSYPAPIQAFFTAFSCPALTQLQSNKTSMIRVLPENVESKAAINGTSRKYRKRIDSTSNPQITDTFHIKDSNTVDLFSEMLTQRCKYYSNRPKSTPPEDKRSISNDSLEMRSQPHSLSDRSNDKPINNLCTLDAVPCCKSPSYLNDFLDVNDFETQHYEGPCFRITECSLNEETLLPENSTSASGQEEMALDLSSLDNSYDNWQISRKNLMFSYTDSMEGSCTLPPIYELEGECSEVTELTATPQSIEFWSQESLLDDKFEGGLSDEVAEEFHSDLYAQNGSGSDSIMSYYSLVPLHNARDSIRNVDHLVTKLAVGSLQECSSSSSPYPMTPPNTCDSSPRVVKPPKNNLHGLSGVEVK